VPARLEPTALKTHIRADYDAAAAAWGPEIGPRVFRVPAERLVADLAPRRGSRSLDLACGSGLVARALAARVGPDLVRACDLSPAQVAGARVALRSVGLDGIDVRVMDAERLRYTAGSFDIVACGFGLNHFPRPIVALRGALRVLAPGGRGGFSVWQPADHPIGRRLDERMAEVLDGRLADEYVRCAEAFARLGERNSEPHRLIGLMEEAGFRSVSSRAHAFTVDYRDAATFVNLVLGREDGALRAARLSHGERTALRHDLIRSLSRFGPRAYRVRRGFVVVIGQKPSA